MTGKMARIRHNKNKISEYKKFKCILCGKKTNHHHNLCDKHYNKSKK